MRPFGRSPTAHLGFHTIVAGGLNGRIGDILGGITARRRVLTIVAAAGGAVPAAAQERARAPAPEGEAAVLAHAVRARVERAGLERRARAITAHERPSGSPGEAAAIDSIVAALRGAGVPFAVHEVRTYTSNPVSASVTVPGTDFAPRAITLSFSGATEGVAAPLVDVGTLADLPGLEPGTGERLVVRHAAGFEDVRGKVALVTGQPRNVPTAVLEALGAAAVVFVNPEERLNDLIVTSTWGTPSLSNAHRLPTLPVAHIARSDGERLRELARTEGARVRVATEVETGWTTLRLVVARVGLAATADGPYVLFGGHIDAWYHGGTDEGASNAAMLELALAFHAERERMRRGLAVAWWPGHSNARYGGSTWFADRFFDELRRRAVAYVNVDGIGQRGAKRYSATASPALAWLGEGVLAPAAHGSVRVGRPGRNSDQSFNGVGIPLLQLNHTRLDEDGGYWWWHTPEDTYDKIDLAVLEEDAGLYADALAALASEPILPLDLAAEVKAIESALGARERESGGALDLSEARARAGELAGTLASLEAAVRAATPSPDLDRALLQILRPLHRVMFVPDSDHHPDPGLEGDPLPGLAPARVLAEEPPASDRYGFARAYLERERNRVLEAIDEAAGAAERLLGDLRRLG